jgi:hypothetical protein
MLNAGWNWLSLGVDPPSTNLTNIFSGLSLSNLDYIKTTTESSVYYAGTGWFGDLVSVPKNELVKFKKSTSQVFNLTGKEINPSLTYVPVTTGWNRIGYLLKGNSPLGLSFDKGTLPTGDLLLKSKEASALYYPASGWVGDLDSLKVLNGYMLNTATDGSIHYNAEGIRKKSLLKPVTLFQRNELFAIYHIHPFDFEYSANLIGEIVDDEGENIIQKGDLLIAYIDGESRGVSEAYYVPDLARYVFCLTIFSNSDSVITFQVKSLNSKNNTLIAENFVFTSDVVFGEPFKPIRLHLSKTGTNGGENPSVKVYPNPVKDHLYIDSESEISKISVYNSLGNCIRILLDVSGNTAQIKTQDLASGVYILKIETKNGLEIKKFIKSTE